MFIQAETNYKEQLAVYINNLPPEQRKIELMKFMNSEAKSYKTGPPKDSPAKPQKVGSPNLSKNTNSINSNAHFNTRLLSGRALKNQRLPRLK